MKILFIGLGSIGQRHLRNLLTLGEFEYFAYRKRNYKLPQEFENVNISIINSLTDIPNLNLDFCIIAAPPIVQQEVLPIIISNGLDFFIEKPIGPDLGVLKKLIPVIIKKQIISMVGYNLRYHPIHNRLIEILKDGTLGNISAIRSVVGQYLPDWHPNEDYRNGYSANRKLGGGVILDLIHEIDFVYSLFGKVIDLKSFYAKTSHLEIDVEDIAEIIMKFDSGIIGSVHLDYINRNGQRNGTILGDEASLNYDLLKSEIIILHKNGIREVEVFEFVRNNMYLNELTDFLYAVHSRNELSNNFAAGLEVLSYAERALNG
jgi:predicted dehydrogenase